MKKVKLMALLTLALGIIEVHTAIQSIPEQNSEDALKKQNELERLKARQAELLRQEKPKSPAATDVYDKEIKKLKEEIFKAENWKKGQEQIAAAAGIISGGWGKVTGAASALYSGATGLVYANPLVAPTAIVAGGVYSTGIGNRLVNWAGYRYSKMRDYPHARSGVFEIHMAFTNPVKVPQPNPTIILAFNTGRCTVSCDPGLLIRLQAPIAEAINNARNNNRSLVEAAVKTVFEIIAQNETQITITVGIEDESGAAGTSWGRLFHTFNRRWLTPITFTWPDIPNDNEVVAQLLFVAQLKDMTSNATYHQPSNLRDINALPKAQRQILLDYYDTENPKLVISSRGTILQDAPLNFIDSLIEMPQGSTSINITVEFTPNTPETEGIPLSTTIYYLDNVQVPAEHFNNYDDNWLHSIVQIRPIGQALPDPQPLLPIMPHADVMGG